VSKFSTPSPLLNVLRSSTVQPSTQPSIVVPTTEELRAYINARLDTLVPVTNAADNRLTAAMRYSLLAPGKRIRPLMAIAATVDLGGSVEAALDPACAIEIVHTASLVMDDLPSMDNAMLRRGQVTTHCKFGENTAMLAAVSLLNCAYGVITHAPRLDAATRLRAVNILVSAVGPEGLTAGQEDDLHLPAGLRRLDSLETLNHRKTGVLFAATLEIAGCIANVSTERVAALRECGRHLGLAFQLADDLLDQNACAADVGKDVCKDNNKITLLAALGAERAGALFGAHLQMALEALGHARASSGALGALIRHAFKAVPA
jgi:geranylgeranyl diphosphate synthase, type II